MGEGIEQDRRNVTSVVTGWLEGFAAALAAGDPRLVAATFEEDGHWRDVVAFTGDLRTFSGAEAIAAALTPALAATQPCGFALDPSRAAPRLVTRAGREAIEAFFRFETRLGYGEGVLRLAAGAGVDAPRAWTLLTALKSLRGAAERSGDNRPSGDETAGGFGEENWLERRVRLLRYEDRDPVVLVVGGGQAGLAAAARLGALGVDTLIVDRHQRIGDNWRRRYHSLKLHNETWVNHLPYLPFPPTWPTYMSKDKLANWFEAYADSMELNVWTQTEFLGGRHDPETGAWTVRVRRADGEERTLSPRHVILATGVSGIPNMPKLPGIETFAGAVIHSSAYADGAGWAGRSAIVVGAGNSGHDVAQDLQGNGASVTLVQRGPIMVASKEPSGSLTYALYAEGPSTDDCDLLTVATPYPLLRRGYQLRTAQMRELDRTLLKNLEAAGFALHFGEDDTGYQMSYLRRGGGYYLNVGCSDLIVDGKVGLAQYADIEGFVPQGARLRSGAVIRADLVVMATGYRPQQDLVRALFGAAVAEAVGPIWGFDAGGELRNMWRPTAQPGLWFTAGSLAQCRIYSQYLALQIKAQEMARPG